MSTFFFVVLELVPWDGMAMKEAAAGVGGFSEEVWEEGVVLAVCLEDVEVWGTPPSSPAGSSVSSLVTCGAGPVVWLGGAEPGLEDRRVGEARAEICTILQVVISTTLLGTRIRNKQFKHQIQIKLFMFNRGCNRVFSRVF